MKLSEEKRKLLIEAIIFMDESCPRDYEMEESCSNDRDLGCLDCWLHALGLDIKK